MFQTRPLRAFYDLYNASKGFLYFMEYLLGVLRFTDGLKSDSMFRSGFYVL